MYDDEGSLKAVPVSESIAPSIARATVQAFSSKRDSTGLERAGIVSFDGQLDRTPSLIPTLPDLLDTLVGSSGFYVTGRFQIKHIWLTPSLYELVQIAPPQPVSLIITVRHLHRRGLKTHDINVLGASSTQENSAGKYDTGSRL